MTVGVEAIGRRAIGALRPADARASDLPWQPAFAAGDAAPILVVEIETWPSPTATSPVVRRFSTHGLLTGPYETPPSTLIRGRFLPRLAVDQAVPRRAGGLLGGAAGRSVGEVALANGDGGLDSLLDEAVDGRRVRILVGGMVGPGQRVEELGPSGPVEVVVDRVRPAPWSTFGVALEAAGDAWEADLREIRLGLQDPAAVLRAPVQPRVYRGTGGAEGTADLRDRPKPLVLGYCLQVPLVAIDPARLIYQLHDGQIRRVIAVYDRGVELPSGGTVAGGYTALAAASVDEGSWLAAPAAGLIRLGSPPAGAVTADVEGDVLATVLGYERPWADGRLWSDGRGWVGQIDGPGYSDRPGTIALALLTRAGVPRSSIAVETLLELDDACPWRCGLAVGTDERPTVEQALDRLIGPLGCVLAPDRSGRYRAAALRAPPGQIRLRRLTADRILAIEIAPVPWRVAPRAIVVGYRRHWRVQSEAELAGAVPLDRRAELGRAWRTVRHELPWVATAHPTSAETDLIETALADEADARELAARLAALHGPSVRRLALRCRGIGLAELGDPIEIVHPRFGLASGAEALVIGVRSDLASLTTALDVLIGVGAT